MVTPQELLDEQKQKELDAKVDQAAKAYIIWFWFNVI